jgi:hypothetical protein
VKSETDAVLNIKKFESDLKSLSLKNLSVAFIPAGVAAFPRPKIFAEIFSETAFTASLSWLEPLKNTFISGKISFLSFSVIPLFSQIFISPDHKTVAAKIEIARLTASFAPLKKAAPVSEAVLLKNEVTTEKITIITTAVSSISNHTLSLKRYLFKA